MVSSLTCCIFLKFDNTFCCEVDATNDILGALGQPINRTLAEKRIRLAIAIGVNTSVL
jgi:hypothetical protein